MNNILTLNVVLLFLVVTNTIILIILLSYKKESFEHLLNYISSQKKQSESIMLSISQIDKKLEILSDKQDECEMLSAQKELKKIRSEVLEQIKSLSDELKESVKSYAQPDNEGEGCNKKSTINMVAYNDAVIAFDNINRKLYKIRKYQKIVQGLADMMISGCVDEKVKFNDMPDEDKSYAANLQSDILMFNRNYRINIISYLQSERLQWHDCVRNPYNKPFDNDWDENILGDEIPNGTIVTRIVQLGFEFPNSTKIGRTKSKTL